MSRVLTLYEVRVFVKIDKHADFCSAEPFDELESAQAKGSYDREVSRANAWIGTEQTVTTQYGDDVTGLVSRIVVELIESKTDGTRRWNTKVVGEDPVRDIDGMRTWLDVRPRAPVGVSP